MGRLCVVAVLAATILVGGLLEIAVAQDPAAAPVAAAQPRVRMSWQTFIQDPARVQSLMRGVAEMKRRSSADRTSAEYRTSWEYWAAIHGYLGPDSEHGSVEEKMGLSSPVLAGFFSGLTNLSKPAKPVGLADRVWNKCQHGGRFFFAWHRMYLFFFERVLRDAAQDPTLTLPYWDYTDPQHADFPPEFASPDNGVGEINPLYDERRAPGLGQLVHISASNTDIDDQLTESDFSAFQDGVEGRIHGFVHCAVGNACGAPIMGLVETAANDPVFWLHHANVDRMWSCWSKRYSESSNPIEDPEWMNQGFEFIDEKGNLVQMKVSELFSATTRIDYVYDRVENCERKPIEPAAVSIALDEAPTEKGSLAFETLQGPQVTELQDNVVQIQGSGNTEAAKAIKTAARAPSKATTRVMLKLEDVRIDSQPGVMMEVNLKVSRRGEPKKVGVIPFFTWPRDHHGQMVKEGRSFSFDVTELIPDLAKANSSRNGIEVSFVPASGVSGRTQAIDERRMRAARFRVGRISLVVARVATQTPR
jgi:hypothetical protein